VVAAAAGKVRFAGAVGTSGLTVSIRTSDGLFDTSYLHLSSTAVRDGDEVSAGERVGAVGTTGKRSAAAPHLHFGVRDAGTRHGYHDPLAFLPPPPVPDEHPRPLPAPSPTPVPVAPAPDPHRAPIPEQRRLPLPAPHPTPVAAPKGIPHLGPAPHGAPSAAPHATPHGSPSAAPHGAPSAAPHAAPHGAPSAPPHGATQRAPSPAPHGAPRTGPHTGPDLGYALACVGLLLAAALLGLTEDRRHAGGRSRGHGHAHAGVRAALRRLLGPRAPRAPGLAPLGSARSRAPE
jgi:hypothetical protein